MGTNSWSMTMTTHSVYNEAAYCYLSLQSKCLLPVKIITINIPINRMADDCRILWTETIIAGEKYGWLNSMDSLAMFVALPYFPCL
jgi:hypothetical protein